MCEVSWQEGESRPRQSIDLNISDKTGVQILIDGLCFEAGNTHLKVSRRFRKSIMSKANKHCINVVIMILYELSADSRQFWYIIAIAQLWVLREVS
jgi:hypothetical protein